MESEETASAGKRLSNADLDSTLELLEGRFAAIVRKEVTDIFELKIKELHDLSLLQRDHHHSRQVSESFSVGHFASKIKSEATRQATSFSRLFSPGPDPLASAPPPPLQTSFPSKTGKLESAGALGHTSTSSALSVHQAEEEYLQMARIKSKEAVTSSRAEPELETARCRCRVYLQSIVNTGYFELFWFLVIIANAVLLGSQVQMVALGLFDEDGFAIADTVFTCLFMQELLMRLVADGSLRYFFFKSRNRAWHWFDTVVVTCTCLDLFLTVLLGSVIGKARAFRLLRLMRILRAARSLKVVQHIAPLRMLLESIIGTMRTLLWSFILLLIMTFVFAIVFTDAMASSFEDPASQMHRLRYFGDLNSSILVLFWSVMGGTDCWTVQEELVIAGSGWSYVFALYCAISIFAVLNVMTAMFCQSAMESAGKDHELVVSAWNENRAALATDLERLFETLRGQEDGAISLEALEVQLQGKWIQDFFLALEIEVSDVVTLFRLLDRTGDGLVDGTEFVEGCLKLRGNAKAIDVTAIKFDVKGLRLQFLELSKAVLELAESQRRQVPPQPGEAATGSASVAPPTQQRVMSSQSCQPIVVAM